MPTSAGLPIIRVAIADDPGHIKNMIDAPVFRKYFGEVSGERLKTAPRGYVLNHTKIELLRHKQLGPTIPSAVGECLSPILPSIPWKSSLP